jgi:septum formation protein
MPSPRLILASASPRRRELLFSAGYDFEVHPADIDEEDYPVGTLPADLAQLLATLKAQALSARFPNDVILAADTVVAFGDRPLGKPANEIEAEQMLRLLAGTTHVVITGVCAMHTAAGFERATRVMSAVHMRDVTDKEIAAYVQSGDWRGKAGGYGIQDERKEPFVTRMAGSHSNIVGLPMETTTELLKAAGVVPPRASQTAPRS